ncbi:MAG: adenylate/guanylate cyclase domain-containing protein [Gammaproteobacteria bacterium]|nr:HAMP domain-containing protein [Pseudomonadales bacterium]MCP5347196.1 HAMP domain-containing protein [Pseudomonadales bacterium]
MSGLTIKPGFRSFRSRLIVFLLILLLPLLGGTYLFVNSNNRSYTEKTINSYLESGAGVFDFTLAQQSQTLVSILSSLTWDFGFRSAFGTGDQPTLFGAGQNVLERSLGSVETLLVADMEGRVIIDTALQGFDRLSGAWQRLLEDADRDQEGLAEAIISIRGIPHRLIAVPLYLPRQVAWIIGGYPLDQEVLDRVKQNTLSEVSLVRVDSLGNHIVASTLPPGYWSALAEEFSPSASGHGLQKFNLGGEIFGSLSRILNPDSSTDEQLVALIHRSYQENLANEKLFQDLLARFYLLILAVSILAVLFLARSVTRPVQKLAGFVSRIDKGEYDATLTLNSQDELGVLADSVNSMARGLAEKEKVRDLLGKVVSRQIAERLIKNPVQLEGEEKVTTIMYVDIKGFTGFCEGRSPRQVLNVLNGFLSSVAGQVESHCGVVDKFMGDGVMALYGAPVAHERDVENALHSALMIERQWRNMAEGELAEFGLQPCIGIHTGLVVAGNLGSSNRMNYSVVGDTVNLAARLESLTRYYGVTCIVSEETASKGRGLLFRELDLVRVYGRRDPVRIYQLIGETGRVEASMLQEIQHFQTFLECYRNRQWDEAEHLLSGLSAGGSTPALYSLYAERIAAFRRAPPPADWQGIFVFDKK